jgi:murein DD-endopeptidase MepM/ murein hydrolase activator NlpD
MLASALGPLLTASANASDDPSTQKQQVDGQLHAAAGDVASADAAVAAASAKVTAVRTQLAAAQSVLASAQGQLHAADLEYQRLTAITNQARAKAVRAQHAVDVATEHLNATRRNLVQAARTAFVDGPAGQLAALVHATDPSSLADGLGLLQHVMDAKTGQLSAVRKAEQVLAAKKLVLVEAEHTAADAQSAAAVEVGRRKGLVLSAQQATAKVADLQKQEQTVLAAARTTAGAAQSRYSGLQAESERLGAVLAARAAAAKAAAARAAANSGGAAPPPTSTGPSSGGLIMPVAGYYSSGFGYRIDPISGASGFHPGQDIAAPTGTPIYAATSGEVTIAGWEGGYGNYTCISRDADFATCYGHQSAIFVSVGQYVTQGQHIGNVGTTGYSTGPHLHFEVRIDGTPVNPLPYLP